MPGMVTKDKNLARFFIKREPLTVCAKYQLDVLEGKFFNVLVTIRAVNDNFVKISNGIFVGKYPHFPSGLIRLASPKPENFRRCFILAPFAKYRRMHVFSGVSAV